MVQKNNSRMNWLESKWKLVLDCVESVRLRRGKAMHRQGNVNVLTIEGGRISARIAGPRIRGANQAHEASFPCLNTEPHWFDLVTEVLFERSDWLATLLADEWDESFWEHLLTLGVQWFPTASSAEAWCAGAACTCKDEEMPCSHVAAALYALLGDMELSPWTTLRYIGVGREEVLAAVHQRDRAYLLANTPPAALQQDTSLQTAANGHPAEEAGRNATSLKLLPEENYVYQLSREDHEWLSEGVKHRLAPHWSANHQKTWYRQIRTSRRVETDAPQV